MTDTDAVDILLVEDNPQDAELTIRALKKHNLANRLITVEDGAQALDFIFLSRQVCDTRTQPFAQGSAARPETSQGEWPGSLARAQAGREDPVHPRGGRDLLARGSGYQDRL